MSQFGHLDFRVSDMAVETHRGYKFVEKVGEAGEIAERAQR